MNGMITIPKGKNILDFLQELDGGEKRTKNAWIFMRKDVVEELMNQCDLDVISPALSLVDGNCSFVLQHYGSKSSSNIGIIVLHSEHRYDFNHPPLWFSVTLLFLNESSPVSIAFQHPSELPSEAIFLILEG